MNKKELTLMNVLNEFTFEVSNPKTADLKRIISHPAIHRKGLEIAGIKLVSREDDIIGWGSKENGYFASKTPSELNKILKSTITKKTPFVILSKGITPKIFKSIKEVCDLTTTPLIRTNLNLTTILSTLGLYLATQFAPTDSIHGSLMIINGVGVAIIGDSGIGKSESVLELIQRGHSFVSDDTIILRRVGNVVMGEAAPITKGIIEARGIGLIDIQYVYGQKSVKGKTEVQLIVELKHHEKIKNVDRLGNQDLKVDVLGGDLTKMIIPVRAGRATSSLIEAAVNSFRAKKHGMDPLALIKQRSTNE